jgi:hypothetical protein
MRWYLLAMLPYCIQHFNHIFKVTLRVHPTREGQPHEFSWGWDLLAGRGVRPTEHHAAEFHGTNATFQVERVD